MGAAFRKGDRVIATDDLAGIGKIMTRVRQGDAGSVIKVDDPWIGAATFTVKFDNGEIIEVGEDDLYGGE